MRMSSGTKAMETFPGYFDEFPFPLLWDEM